MFNYILSCKVCGLQYVGSANEKFCFGWDNYKENDRKALRGKEHMQPEPFEHYVADNHNCFLNDCSVTLIDKIDGSDPTRREEYWRKALTTVAPYGLNTLNRWLLLHAFIHFSAGVFNVKYILLNLSCMFCKEFYFCILGCSIILFGGCSYWIETNQFIWIAI